MNIKQAKEQIKNTVTIYLQKDEYGEYCIPYVRQRPIFLIGAPGIGKTAIMEQIAQELDIGIVAYSMSHHTRQSALGLPFITQKVYDGKEFSVSEYTMSEIIATVYKMIEDTGVKEGILFLDEINCISETLAPSMLQFLQMKKFGTHSMPEGWVIVTAGNPPQYNKSVREFDIATMDRLKIVDIEPDFKVWRQYAVSQGLHGAVISYLDIRKNDFYMIETSIKGKSYVTARGWEDLSDILYMYEKNKFMVDESLVIQYIRNDEVAGDFSIYYDLYNKYKSDYEVESILTGEFTKEISDRAILANFDERISLIGILMNMLHSEIRLFLEKEKMIQNFRAILIDIKNDVKEIALSEKLQERVKNINKELNRRLVSSRLSKEEKIVDKMLLKLIKDAIKESKLKNDFDTVKELFNVNVDKLEEDRTKISNRLDNLFFFAEDNWGVGKEMVIIVNDITMNTYTSKYIQENGCDKYYLYNKELLFTDKKESLFHKIKDAQYFIMDDEK